jgi:hypothetical protein
MFISTGKHLTVSIVLLLGLFLLVACAEPIDRITVSPELPTETPQPIITETPRFTPAPPLQTPIPIPEDANLQRMIFIAKEDLAQKLNLPVDEVLLLEWKAVTWSDSSLGCPEPGQNYLPVLQDGYLVRLEAMGRAYQYHSGEDYSPFYCQHPQKPYEEGSVEADLGEVLPTKEVSLEKHEPIQPPTDRASQDLVAQAKSDLAARSGINVDEIELLKFEEVTWRDGSLGCPQPGMGYIQVLIDGHRILLRSGEKVYHYHSGGNQPPFLCRNPQEPLSINSEG